MRSVSLLAARSKTSWFRALRLVTGRGAVVVDSAAALVIARARDYSSHHLVFDAADAAEAAIDDQGPHNFEDASTSMAQKPDAVRSTCHGCSHV